MKRLLLISVLAVPFFAFTLVHAAPAVSQNAAERPPHEKPSQELRIFLKTGAKKTYVRGYQWATLDLNRKINLVESARRGALKLGALMTRPAETYVLEVDKFFKSNPSLMQMELGPVIQGVAISLKDWDNGGTHEHE